MARARRLAWATMGRAPSDDESPEAEWGFADGLRADVERIAAEPGYSLVRIVFDEPQVPSPIVAELYRWWYRRRGVEAKRLLVESLILLDPWRTLRLGAVPVWTKFNTEPSAEGLEAYLDSADPNDEIDLTLFSHGILSLGLAPIGRWHSILARAKRRSGLLGADLRAYPAEFATFARFHPALRRIPSRCPLPSAPLTLEEVAQFLAESGGRFPVEWYGLGADRDTSTGNDCSSKVRWQ